ncbi:A/G-specific adenine glycosylase [Maricaulis sp. D1M11]|uniref:A/G-specific adenine glycosylase n=1 Tax=Maricaulis sp. D1M11 TaxID=3076117 RepID=UPI0039B6C200
MSDEFYPDFLPAPEVLRRDLLAWYDRQGRALPWRIRPEDAARGAVADPYAIWLSEIMLQQTTVPHATPYWLSFLKRWPRVQDLAAAPREDVLSAWAGLGYYARARNLHACAIEVSETLDGVFPSTLKALQALPGIGEYTANAIRAAAFDAPASVVDGNVERVITRMVRLEIPLPAAKPTIRRLAGSIADPQRSRDYAQAIMDLGATVCTPKSPTCGGCPWSSGCQARKAGDMTAYPRKTPKKAKPVRRGTAWMVSRDSGGQTQLWLKTRPDRGLLGGMREVPSTGWSDAEADTPQPFDTEWEPRGEIRHVFTHFELRLDVVRAPAPAGWEPESGEWVGEDDLRVEDLPSVMRKIVRQTRS